VEQVFATCFSFSVIDSMSISARSFNGCIQLRHEVAQASACCVFLPTLTTKNRLHRLNLATKPHDPEFLSCEEDSGASRGKVKSAKKFSRRMLLDSAHPNSSMTWAGLSRLPPNRLGRDCPTRFGGTSCLPRPSHRHPKLLGTSARLLLAFRPLPNAGNITSQHMGVNSPFAGAG